MSKKYPYGKPAKVKKQERILANIRKANYRGKAK